jgi:hypothetical protein
MVTSTKLEGHIGLHIPADIGRIAIILSLSQIFVGYSANGCLKGIDLWKHHGQVEDAKYLGQAAHYKYIGGLPTVQSCSVKLGEPLPEKLSAFPVSPPDYLWTNRFCHLIVLLLGKENVLHKGL